MSEESERKEDALRTRRQEMAELLRKEALSASRLAKVFSVTLKIVEEDLRHIARSTSCKLEQIPPRCESCEFEFRDRTKYRKPSRCPKCKCERICEALFRIDGSGKKK